jgi:hypothetical protein
MNRWPWILLTSALFACSTGDVADAPQGEPALEKMPPLGVIREIRTKCKACEGFTLSEAAVREYFDKARPLTETVITFDSCDVQVKGTLQDGREFDLYITGYRHAGISFADSGKTPERHMFICNECVPPRPPPSPQLKPGEPVPARWVGVGGCE